MKNTINNELIEKYIDLKDKINHLTKIKNEIRLIILQDRFFESDKFSINIMEKKHIDYRKIVSDFLNPNMINFENYTDIREYLYVDEKDEDEVNKTNNIDYDSIIKTAKKRSEYKEEFFDNVFIGSL